MTATSRSSIRSKSKTTRVDEPPPSIARTNQAKQTRLALLRGINVGGKNMLPMKAEGLLSVCFPACEAPKRVVVKMVDSARSSGDSFVVQGRERGRYETQFRRCQRDTASHASNNC
jgi:hypothetical protein